MPKGFKHEQGYATVASIEDGLDYRAIAEKMTADGYKMNHATARNIFVRAMTKLARPVCDLYGVNVTSENLMKTAQDPRFQSGMVELITDILSEPEGSISV
jgi:hypothetical protein